MGLRGPAPKPTALKLLAGNPGKRPLNAAEPRPDTTLPRCPSWLRPEARAEWKRVAARLRDAGVLTYVDRAVLAAYCQSWARWREAEEELAKGSQVVLAASGNKYLNPWLSATSMALKEMTSLAAQLGMTPSSRSRLSATPPGAAEPSLADMLFAGGPDD